MSTIVNIPPTITPYDIGDPNRYEVIGERIRFCEDWSWVRGTGFQRTLFLIGMQEEDLYSTPAQRNTAQNPQLIERAVTYLFTAATLNHSGELVIQFFQNGIKRYEPFQINNGGIMTFCNIFVNDVTRILHCEIPNNPNNTDVHQMKSWLQSTGNQKGWSVKSIQEAEAVQDWVNQGRVAIMLSSGAAADPSDHIALVLPGDGEHDFNGQLWPNVAQAGLIVSPEMNSRDSFGGLPQGNIQFFLHE